MTDRLVSRSGAEVANFVTWLTSPLARAKGLLGRGEPAVGVAVVLAPAVQVHTFFLRFPIDVVMCDAGWRVLWVGRSMAPNRLGPLLLEARHVVELRAGTLPSFVERDTELVLVRE